MNGHGIGTNLSNIQFQSKPFEILVPSEATMYLGRVFSFQQTRDRELRNSINRAWAKFAIYRANSLAVTMTSTKQCNSSSQVSHSVHIALWMLLLDSDLETRSNGSHSATEDDEEHCRNEEASNMRTGWKIGRSGFTDPPRQQN